MLCGGNTTGEGGWCLFCSSGSDPTFMHTAGKSPSELNGTWWEQRRPGDQMPPLKPFVGPVRHLVGRVSHWLPERQQLAGLLVNTLFSFPNSWVVGPIATCVPASAWVAPHQLWCIHAAPWQTSSWQWGWGWGCRRTVGKDIEDAVGSTGDRGLAEAVAAGGRGCGEELGGLWSGLAGGVWSAAGGM